MDIDAADSQRPYVGAFEFGDVVRPAFALDEYSEQSDIVNHIGADLGDI